MDYDAFLIANSTKRLHIEKDWRIQTDTFIPTVVYFQNTYATNNVYESTIENFKNNYCLRCQSIIWISQEYIACITYLSTNCFYNLKANSLKLKNSEKNCYPNIIVDRKHIFLCWLYLQRSPKGKCSQQTTSKKPPSQNDAVYNKCLRWRFIGWLSCWQCLYINAAYKNAVHD